VGVSQTGLEKDPARGSQHAVERCTQAGDLGVKAGAVRADESKRRFDQSVNCKNEKNCDIRLVQTLTWGDDTFCIFRLAFLANILILWRRHQPRKDQQIFQLLRKSKRGNAPIDPLNFYFCYQIPNAHPLTIPLMQGIVHC
jgi:hypothetical protein